MGTRNNNGFIPCIAVHPGEILIDELEARGITQKDFAKQIGMYPANLNKIIKGKSKITIDIADKLEKVLGIRKELWLAYQKDYEINSLLIAQGNHAEPKGEKDEQSMSVIGLLQSINERLGILISMQNGSNVPMTR